jgi:hypothetical protein
VKRASPPLESSGSKSGIDSPDKSGALGASLFPRIGDRLKDLGTAGCRVASLSSSDGRRIGERLCARNGPGCRVGSMSAPALPVECMLRGG